MLKQRIYTAITMLLVLLPALFHPDIRILASLAAVLIGAAVWEWTSLNGHGQGTAVICGLLAVLICGILYFFNLIAALSPVFWLFAGSFWVFFGAFLLHGGPGRWRQIDQRLKSLFGFAILITAWMAFYQAKFTGTTYLLSILLTVWVADISAYFAGRHWGSRKLAPLISPGKSWEGVLGGMAGVIILAICWLSLDSQYPVLQDGLFEKLLAHGWLLFFLSVLFLTLMSVVGDLVESLIKRSAGAKDSSQLLPGHGGVLDRLDALLPVLPLAIMLSQIGSS